MAALGVREACSGWGTCYCQVGLTGSWDAVWSLHCMQVSPKYAAQPHNNPDSEQGQDFQDEEWSIFWIGLPQKTSTVCAAPIGGGPGALPQVVRKPEVHKDVCGPREARSHVYVASLSYH